MKLLSLGLLCVLSIAVLNSCIKGTTPPTQRLAGYEDSMSKVVFVYTGDKITAAHGVRGDGTVIPSPFNQYTYAPNYIRKTLGGGSIEYVLNSYDLPVVIKHHYSVAMSWKPENRFYYKAGTDKLDSLIVMTDYGYNEYIPTYTGNNITHITKVMHSSLRVDTADFYFYTYTNTPNIIRSSNPLLYVYNNGAPVEEISLPLIFSANTLDSFSIAPPAMRSWGRGRFTYGTNAQGKIVSENYSGGTWPYGRKYSYQ